MAVACVLLLTGASRATKATSHHAAKAKAAKVAPHKVAKPAKKKPTPKPKPAPAAHPSAVAPPAPAAPYVPAPAAPPVPTPTPTPTPAVDVAFGTLGTHPDTAAIERADGATVSMIEFSWADDEPQQGVYNTQYENMMRNRFAALKNSGMRITLALGLHFTPAWVAALPGSRYVDQYGHVSDEANFIFNSRIRALATSYVNHLSTLIPFGSVWSVRITSGGDAEILYPGGGSYWAFDAAAQNGLDMPADMARNPFPGWRPGTGGLSAAQVATWASWYIGALDNVAAWQYNAVKNLGFKGFYQFLTPGLGALPQVYDYYVHANLPDSVVGVGAVWDRFYQGLTVRKNAVAYVSSLADGSGGNSGCLASDSSVALDSQQALSWSAARWISRIADANGLLKGGENPGYVASPEFQSNYVDPGSSGMAAITMQQARSCKMQVVYWAHDDQLWDGTVSPAAVLGWAAPSGALPALAK